MFGYPVEHSLSPAMHNAAIAALGLHYVYIPFSIRPNDLEAAIRSLPVLGIAGINLTIPHKERVIAYLDSLSPEARAVGAVNTVQIAGGRLMGYNTDGEGFLAPLKARGFNARGAKVVVLGAGGAARSVVYRLAADGAEVTVANRTSGRAAALVHEYGELLPGSKICAVALDESLGPALEEADLVVNATSAGMHPEKSGMPPIPPDALHKGQTVYDLIYRPLETKLLAAARERGAQTLNGVDMLVQQGAASFEIWTGTKPPADVMKQAVLEKLDTESGIRSRENRA